MTPAQRRIHNAFLKGKRAFHAGVRREHCPYAFNGYYRNAWVEGWNAGLLEYSKELERKAWG